MHTQTQHNAQTHQARMAQQFSERFLSGDQKCRPERYIEAKKREICAKNGCSDISLDERLINSFLRNMDVFSGPAREFDVAVMNAKWRMALHQLNQPDRLRRRHHNVRNYRTRQVLSWKQLLVRSGFLFKESGDALFIKEDKPNREYFWQILEALNLENFFDLKTGRFSPRVQTFSQDLWLDTIAELNGGAEAGHPDELKIMDSAIAGVVRETNLLGFRTAGSCDGHGHRKNWFVLYKDHLKPFKDFLESISEGQWSYDVENHTLINKQLTSREDPRIWLLELADRLHEIRKIKNLFN